METMFSNYHDYNYINALLFNNLHRIPNDIDAIVGIPRSGMITAVILAEFKSLPVTDIFSFVQGIDAVNLNSNGSRTKQFKNSGINHILLVDDTAGTGNTMRNSVNFIRDKYKDLKITTFSTFVESFSTNAVDIYCEVMRYQFMPYSILKRGMPLACIDMDGIFTEDVPPMYDTDDENYVNFLMNQRQMYVPDSNVGVIVTGRLEKYRDVTEAWLKKHNIRYSHLVMLNLESKLQRNRINVGEYKANVYLKSGRDLFIESNYNEAITIKKISNKAVYCTQICNMV